MATVIANAQAREELRTLAEEQAALRRVATLVARGMPSAEILAAVAEEAGRLLDADLAHTLRYEPDDIVSVVAAGAGLATTKWWSDRATRSTPAW